MSSVPPAGESIPSFVRMREELWHYFGQSDSIQASLEGKSSGPIFGKIQASLEGKSSGTIFRKIIQASLEGKSSGNIFRKIILFLLLLLLLLLSIGFIYEFVSKAGSIFLEKQQEKELDLFIQV